jgi:hypothetical protein
MGCERYKDWLTEAALGALDAARESELHLHVRHCECCGDALGRERLLLAAIDRAAAAGLVAEPSSGFAARVRLRLAHEAATPARWATGWIPAAAVASLVLVLTAWLVRPTRPVPRTAANPPQISAPRADTVATPSTNAAVNHSGQRVVRSLLASGHLRRRNSGEPEVLVPAGEWAGVIQLCRALESNRVDRATLMAAPASPPEPLEVPELTIKPLEKAERGVGEETSAGEGRR